MMLPQDEIFMQRAIELAEQAALAGEVPVGAVVVLNNEIIGEGSNRPIATNDPSAHAEMIALRQAGAEIGNYRLLNTTLYVTLEPCMMCAGAMVHARVSRLVYGAYDHKSGAVQTKACLLDQAFLNHKISHVGGVVAQTCAGLLTAFFKSRRI